MAKVENVKTQIELNPQDRRIIRDLTKAIDRLSRNLRPTEDQTPKRLSEPADDPALSDDNEDHSQEENPSLSRGGFVNVRYTEPAASIDPKFGTRVVLGANVVNALRASVGKYSALR